MGKETRLLNLCESTINTLNNALNSNIPKELEVSLKQKLFLLNAGISDFKEENINDNNIERNTTKKYYLDKNQSNLKQAVVDFEKDIIKDAIDKYGSKRKAAKALGVDHSTLIKKCQRYGI